MAQPSVALAVPETRLAFPFNLRPLMAGWNALYLTPGPVAPVDARSAEWNRGAYLVDGLGHCGACHSARDALGAERGGQGYLAGARVDGWEAPALTSLGHAPIPWTETDLYDYLRHGHSARHGSAGGPMTPVVQQLAVLPDADIRAMATYLATFNATDAPAPDADALVAQSQRPDRVGTGATARLFTTACGACHHDGSGPALLGLNIPLALNTQLHGERPDNLLRTILEGVREPSGPSAGFMPAYADHLDDAQIAELAAYLRGRYAPGRPPWPDLAATVARLRLTPSH